MFRNKTTRRNIKRALSPLKPATDISGVTNILIEEPVETPQKEDTKEAPIGKEPVEKPHAVLGKQLNTFFEAESAAVNLTRPWLRLERGLRLQKFRIFAETCPELKTPEEKDQMYRFLLKANDMRLLNTKQNIGYEEGQIKSIRGLKISWEDGKLQIKIEAPRLTKKNACEA